MAQLTFSDISGFGFVSSANRKGSVVKRKHTQTHTSSTSVQRLTSVTEGRVQ